MKEKTGIYLLTGAYVLMLMAMFILPFFMVPDHSIIRNTLSELGAQFSPYSWIMNSIFAALALSSVISGWGYFEGFVFQRFILLIFAISLTLAAIFNHAPVSSDIQYSIIEDGWHSYLMNTTWLSFIILTFSTALIPEKPVNRPYSVITGLSAILLLLLFTEADGTAGIWQRLQFIISFAWMMYTFKTIDQ
jgi:hypothetical membrane protein